MNNLKIKTSVDDSILLDVQNIVKTFRMGDKTLDVLKGVSLSLKRGEIASILGASGAGKSTLLHIIGTLDTPDSGTVFLSGEGLIKNNGSRLAVIRNRMIGFVFQFHYLLPEFTALENVAMPGLISRMPQEEVYKRAEQLLSAVNLADRIHHKPGELSGGELQRVAVARALINNPLLVLADEPTGNLDRANGDIVYELMLSLSKSARCAFLVVTHNELIASRTDRIFTLFDGIIQ